MLFIRLSLHLTIAVGLPQQPVGVGRNRLAHPKLLEFFFMRAWIEAIVSRLKVIITHLLDRLSAGLDLAAALTLPLDRVSLAPPWSYAAPPVPRR
jgi:hypothetical protein